MLVSQATVNTTWYNCIMAALKYAFMRTAVGKLDQNVCLSYIFINRTHCKMLKTIDNLHYFNSKCGEIFCQGVMKFSITCSFCNMKTLVYDDFIEHFENVHKNLGDALLEVEHELPAAITSDKRTSESVLKDVEEKEKVEALSIEWLDKTDSKTIVANQVKEAKLEPPIENKTNEVKSFLEALQGSVKENLADVSRNDFDMTSKKDTHQNRLNNKSCKETTKKQLDHRSLSKQNEMLKCPMCGIYKNNKYNLESHINSHTGARPYNCQKCGNNFTNSGNLWKHIELVHKGIRTHECAECKKKFQYKSQVKRHEIRVHLKLRPFPCDLCDNSYCTKRELTDHQRKHLSVEVEATLDRTALETSGEVMQDKQHGYVCEHCGKSFAKYSGIWAHRRLHSKEKRYVCNVCNKPMHTSYHLKEHMNTHTGERPHKCEVCGKAFQQKKFLRDHSRIHAEIKAFACKLCDKKFSQAAGLYCHTKTHKHDTIIEDKSDSFCVLPQLSKMV